MADDVPSNDMRYRLRSTVSAERARLPVLRFFGRESGVRSFPLPLSLSPTLFSTRENEKALVKNDLARFQENPASPTVVGTPAMRLTHSQGRTRPGRDCPGTIRISM